MSTRDCSGYARITLFLKILSKITTYFHENNEQKKFPHTTVEIKPRVSIVTSVQKIYLIISKNIWNNTKKRILISVATKIKLLVWKNFSLNIYWICYIILKIRSLKKVEAMSEIQGIIELLDQWFDFSCTWS